MVNFVSSIKFKLTIWYSFILILSSFAFLFIFNILITQHYQNRFVPVVEVELPSGPGQPGWFRRLPEEDRVNIYESRLDDLQTIREISVLMLIPLAVISFGGGYIIAERMLRPLKAVNEKMSTITSKELTETIDYIDSADEMSELVKNFNTMILRLKTNFDSQKQFVENASHELKTPLAVVQTNLAAALEQKGLSKSDAGSLIQTAMRSTLFMDKLIEDLLLLSMLEQKVPKTDVELKNIVLRGIHQLEDLAENKSITMKTHIPEGVYTVHVNEVLMQRAVMNIVENAIKYSPEGTEVGIEMIPDQKTISVSVTDSGPGIPEEKRKRIFERFFRIDTSRSRKTGGVGLGLAIAKEVVELCGGEIKVESNESQKGGSVFRIVLPRLMDKK